MRIMERIRDAIRRSRWDENPPPTLWIQPDYPNQTPRLRCGRVEIRGCGLGDSWACVTQSECVIYASEEEARKAAEKTGGDALVVVVDDASLMWAMAHKDQYGDYSLVDAREMEAA